MKIFGLVVVKNEADIIYHTLKAASAWCDEIYVLDNGSADGTWQLIKQMAQENSLIVLTVSLVSRLQILFGRTFSMNTAIARDQVTGGADSIQMKFMSNPRERSLRVSVAAMSFGRSAYNTTLPMLI